MLIAALVYSLLQKSLLRRGGAAAVTLMRQGGRRLGHAG